MANVNKNIIETRKLASKGRFGDTEIANIDGELQHVNAWEASLISRYGKKGEEIVEAIGSGTINPETGLKENFLLPALGIIAGIGAVRGIAHEGPDFKLTDIWDYSIGRHGLGDMLNIGDKQRALEAQAGQAVGSGMKGLLKQQEQYMGPEGFLARQQGLEQQGIVQDYTKSMKSLASTEDRLISKSNFASSGQIESQIADQEALAGTQYGSAMELSGLKAEKSEADFMANLRQKMNQMIIDYQSATGEPYGGSGPLDELNQLFEDYEGTI